MDDFPGLLAGEFGLKPQGKSAPMAPSRSGHNLRSNHNSNASNSVFDDHDRYSGVVGGPHKFSSASGNSRSLDYDSIFRGPSNSDKSNNYYNDNSRDVKPPVFDKPVYDDDIFDGLPGLKTSSASSVRYDDVFASVSASPPSSRGAQQKNANFDDLLGSLGKKEPKLRNERRRGEKDSQLFDDLIPGFGGSSTPSSARTPSESSHSQKPSSNSAKMASNIMEDPFVVLESTSTPEAASSGMSKDPLEEISKLSSSGKTKVGSSFVSGGVFDDIGHLDSLGKPVSPILSENNNIGKDKSPSRTGATMSGAQNPANEDPIDRFSPKHSESRPQKKVPVDNFQESHRTLFDMPNVSADSRRPSPTSFVNASPNETNSQVDMSPQYEENLETSDDEWLTVSDIPLFTQPTSAPPPSRPPPPIPARVSKSRSLASANSRKKVDEFSSFPKSTQYSHSPRSAHAAAKSPVVSQMDELEEFATGRTRNNVNDHADVLSGENVETNSAAAAAMKEAMDRAEAKFRHAREVREREYLKAARSKEGVQLEKDEITMQDVQEREVKEKQESLDRERQQREREEREREQRRLEKERERAREIEREREQARKAVERATREARERAAAEARIKAERAAVEKAKAEARERAERAAVQRAQAEARERAAAEARERAEKVAAEARERANAEARDKEAQEKAAAARIRSQRAAVERAAAEARERAATVARVNQQKNENDLESFFSMGSRPSSAPRPKANSSDPLFDTQFQSKGRPEAARRTSVGTSSNIRKASSTTNIVDDLTSIFGAAPSSGNFQEVEGESEERRKARMERHQRTQERAAKALAEKNERDLQAQREQADRHRMAETLDVEVKRWAAGKEGNLRALLSTLQYVLWVECGWQPVSLTDLITGASVKKVYRKATLCIHPDKVQQKGATLQQKYIAEKVFDLLKEAWNKFNSEELF